MRRLKSPLYWIIAFLILNIIIRGHGGTNEASRIASLMSMTFDHSFSINNYYHRTSDWAKTPDGKYYSNKAPGPALIGFPFFYGMMKIQEYFSGKKPLWPKSGTLILLSYFFQVIPFALLVAFIVTYMQKRGVSLEAQHFCALALLFGNTSAIFMNMYFGHGLTAIFILAMAWAIFEKRFFIAGFLFGLALLSEYAVVVLIPALVFYAFYTEKNFKWISATLWGGMVPLIFWVWYHGMSFGDPFKTAIHFQNPEFLDMEDKKINIFGIFSLPSLTSLYEIVLGSKRGILFTQPWILLSFLLFLKPSKDLKAMTHFSVLGFVFFVLMNASFGAWHSGASPGPRYICVIFPVMIFTLILGFDSYSQVIKKMLWGLLGISLVFRGIIFGTGIMLPIQNLWQSTFEILSLGSQKQWSKMIFYFVVMGVFTYFVRKSKDQVRAK